MPQVAIAIAQMGSYFCGKLFGVGLVSRVPQHKLRRALSSAGICAFLAWVGFALLPSGVLTLVCAALSGFPLALTWSLVYRYVEGRRCSDAVAGAMGCSIIVGPGLAKLVCAAVVRACARIGISEWHAPLATACVFMPLLALSLRGLHATPPPLPEEVFELGDRSLRIGGVSGIGGASSLRPLMRAHWPGLVAVGVYNGLMLGARELRDIFQPELWLSLYGVAPHPHTFIATELPAAAALLLLLPAISTVRSPTTALLLMHLLMLMAAILLPALTALRTSGAASASSWFALLGAPIFVGTVTVTAGFADRLVAALRLSGSAATLIQTIDAFGYAGSLLTLAAVEYERPTAGELLPRAERLFALVGPVAAACAALSGVYWCRAVRTDGTAARRSERGGYGQYASAPRSARVMHEAYMMQDTWT